MGDALRPDPNAGVWPENVAAVEAFLVCSSQWRMVDGMSGMRVIGLDYAGVKAGLELAGIEVTPDLWSDIRLVEAGARTAMNEV